MDRDKSPLPKGPTKPHFVYIPRKPLLISILVVALGQLILSASTLGLRVRAKNFREETQRFPRLRILYPDGLLPVDDDPPGAFFTQTDELFFASTALCLTSSVVVAMLVVYSFIRGPFKVCRVMLATYVSHLDYRVVQKRIDFLDKWAYQTLPTYLPDHLGHRTPSTFSRRVLGNQLHLFACRISLHFHHPRPLCPVRSR